MLRKVKIHFDKFSNARNTRFIWKAWASYTISQFDSVSKQYGYGEFEDVEDNPSGLAIAVASALNSMKYTQFFLDEECEVKNLQGADDLTFNAEDTGLHLIFEVFEKNGFSYESVDFRLSELKESDSASYIFTRKQ
jgi:hypothetical protein